MNPEQSGQMLGHAMGMIFGPIFVAWITSLVTRAIGHVANKPDWHGWYAGLVVAVLGVFGQVLKFDPMNIGFASIGALIVWLVAAEKSKAS